MRKQNYIPQKQKMIVPRHKQKKQIQVVERKTLAQLFEENNINTDEVAFKIKCSYMLADVVEAFITDVESEMKKIDVGYNLEIMHPIQRLKIHSRVLVELVDKSLTNKESVAKFGERADELKELIMEFFKIK